MLALTFSITIMSAATIDKYGFMGLVLQNLNSLMEASPVFSTIDDCGILRVFIQKI